ncbi:amino acid permease [Leptothermofonsia sichuanensis E412]|uniref:APC family permease n=1 Tax=Leptothermofonsia sichuanensis TaxID=2917832 RepID=UPI001CA67C41|nr:amino acid permease [Leptothermofonsia sichuanensis]QZZ19710.1 amino acid permease [Leptothermofonsia sichuanensis E412]
MNRVEQPSLLEQTVSTTSSIPKPSITLLNAIAIIVGIVIGAGIFETPSLVATNMTSWGAVLQVWLLGGLVSLIGALCYAELATSYPHVGGNYFYLQRAFGQSIATLFAWARMTVIQTGSIALLAFVFGDYASQLAPLGPYSPSLYAALAIALLTALNILGLRQGTLTQNWLAVAQVLGLLLVILIGFMVAPVLAAAPPSTESGSGSWGLALVFVLLSYGGWNEAAYISAEIKHPHQNIVRSLLWSLGIITALYFLINLAYLRGLGLEGMAASTAIAADLLRQTVGEPGAVIISLIVVISTLGSINATIFTGARTNYALGQDVPRFRFLGRWETRPSSPTAGYMLQALISLALVILGTVTRNGFETMVDYTAPIFWFFFLFSTLSLMVLRVQEPHRLRPFRVPLYPVLPILFCMVCGYLLYSSIVYTGIGALVGVAVVALGIPFLQWHRPRLPRS